MTVDPIEFRFQSMERRHDNLVSRVNGIDDHGSRRLGVVEERVNYANDGISKLNTRLDKFQEDVDDRIKDLQDTIVRAAVTVAVSAVGSSLFIWLVVK